MKKAYFIGIAGKTMGPLAKAFMDMGWQVSGSDQIAVYPPISTYLEENGIAYIKGYAAENVPKDADLVIVGRSALLVDPQNPEYFMAKSLGCPVLSYPEVIRDYLLKKNSIVVAGTYGKTTISALLAWILIKAGLNPSFMIGGVPLNFADGVKITNSSWSIVEGDEPPSLFETDPPKFMFYRPKYLLLTATIHDHPEIYKTHQEYLAAFIKLVQLLPKDGLLVYNSDQVDTSVVEVADCPKVGYSLKNLKDVSFKEDKTTFKIIGKNYQTSLLGRYNLENICGAVALSSELGLAQKTIGEAVSSFTGIKTRLEFLGKFGGRFLYWDFAQHPSKVKATFEALKEYYHDQKIIGVFDPAMTGLKHHESLPWYPGAFDQADQVIVGKVGFFKEIAKKDRITGKDISGAIAKTQPNVFYQPIEEKIIEWLVEETKESDVVIFMSSGGLRFTNLIRNTISTLAKGEM